jgi:hypothetical protein
VRAYAVAIQRDRRDDVPRDWLETLRGVPGVSAVTEGSSGRRAMIQASADAVFHIRQLFDRAIIVEERIAIE